MQLFMQAWKWMKLGRVQVPWHELEGDDVSPSQAESLRSRLGPAGIAASST